MRALSGLILCTIALLACSEFSDDAPKPTPIAAPAGCQSDSECKGTRICSGNVCVEPAAPPTPAEPVAPVAPPPETAKKQGTDNSRGSQASFYCINNIRCLKGQLCCPGAKAPCIPGDSMCDATQGSETNDGFECNRFTNEPCAPNQKCVYGKAGHGPLTFTAKCL